MARVVRYVSPNPPSSLFHGPERSSRFAIRCLVPSLPPASDLLPYLERIDANRWYANFGPLVLDYETRLADLTGGHCVTVASGTAALELGIAALGLPPGSRVLLPSFGFPAALLSVLRCGLEPVFCDVAPDTWTVTPAIARAALARERCSLIVPVAAFGVPLPERAWDALAEDLGVAVLIDAGAALGLQRVGTRTNAAYSLHATKPLGIGEGGIFASNDGELAERVRRMSNYGFERSNVTHARATNAKLSEYGAAVGLAQLARRFELLRKREALWQGYATALAGIPGVRLQATAADAPPAVLALMLPGPAEATRIALADACIETRRWYAPPLHRHAVFAEMRCIGPDSRAALPETEALAERTVGLPFHLFLSVEDVVAVCAALRAAMT